ncbi:hypothetical protein CTRU02_210889 [Colletotrichum truncatum]|uniref:Uncharacterized protein n=1 Tax=Colletotrichum truncatum TaxID=5467 RepID=A0ACC3YQ86_COLTU
MGERTGSRVFQWVWSYVLALRCWKEYNLNVARFDAVLIDPIDSQKKKKKKIALNSACANPRHRRDWASFYAHNTAPT